MPEDNYTISKCLTYNVIPSNDRSILPVCGVARIVQITPFLLVIFYKVVVVSIIARKKTLFLCCEGETGETNLIWILM